MFKMTFDEFDSICKKIAEADCQPFGWYPTIEEIDTKMQGSIEDNIPFLIWLANADLDLTEDERETKKYINKLLKEHLELVE